MRMRTQRILAALLSLVLLLALAPAGWAVNFEAQCGITVKPAAADAKHDDAEKTPFVDDIATATDGFVFDLYRVAAAKEVPGYDTYDYTLVEPFTGLDIKSSDPTSRNADFWENLAQEAARIALNLEGASPKDPVKDSAGNYLKGKPVDTPTNIPSTTVTTGTGEEQKSFTTSAGLYLVITRSSDLEWDKTADYVIEKDGKVATLAHTRLYNYYYAPQLISIPTKSEEPNAEIKTSDPGEWIYTPAVILKPTAEGRNGVLKITKTLTDYVDLSNDETYFEPATFSFSVVGTDETGKVVYQREVALSVKEPVDEKEVVTLTDIPIGTTVTVTETYSGAHYTADPNSVSQSVTIKAPIQSTDGTTVTGDELKFSNSNNNYHRGGHGVENKFEFDKSTGKWQWSANGAAQSGAAWVEEG